METQRGGNVKSRGTVGRGFGVEWGRGEGRHASVPGHQLCEGRKRRKKRRRRRKSGEGGRKQHHASRSYIGGARADAAGKKTREREGGPMSILALLFSSWKRCWSNTFLDWWLISPESWWLLAKKETCGKTMKTFILCFENISSIFYFLITSLHLLPKFILLTRILEHFQFHTSEEPDGPEEMCWRQNTEDSGQILSASDQSHPMLHLRIVIFVSVSHTS